MITARMAAARLEGLSTAPHIVNFGFGEPSRME
jgi:hypothetical protein